VAFREAGRRELSGVYKKVGGEWRKMADKTKIQDELDDHIDTIWAGYLREIQRMAG
jgi:hypothetical protein